MSWQPDEFEDLAAELRRRVGAEFVQEAAELERLTDLQRRRRGSMADAARAAMHRGDVVALACGSRRWTGSLTAVGDDYLVLSSDDLIVEASLSRIALELQPARSGGRAGKPASATWRARLRELETNAVEVEIYVPSVNLTIIGRISLVATDYVEIDDGDRRVSLPLRSIAAVIRSRPR